MASRLISTWQAKGHNPARDPEDRSGPVGQLTSVFTRAWVLAVAIMVAVGFIALVAEALWGAAAGLIAAFTLFSVAIDALIRRCPSCRRWLAGTLTRIEQDGTMVTLHSTPTGLATGERNLHQRSWACVHCGHQWTSRGR